MICEVESLDLCLFPSELCEDWRRRFKFQWIADFLFNMITSKHNLLSLSVVEYLLLGPGFDGAKISPIGFCRKLSKNDIDIRAVFPYSIFSERTSGSSFESFPRSFHFCVGGLLQLLSNDRGQCISQALGNFLLDLVSINCRESDGSEEPPAQGCGGWLWAGW